MDAGVPIKAPVAGVAMGLVLEGDRFQVLTDILGDEDHLGDMDFKVAGTAEGVTALQMDIKIEGITKEIMRVALDQAREARLQILGEMGKTQADRVVSSLPWAIWSESLQNEVFSAILDVLAPDGLMVTFGYVHAQPLPAARRLRAALASRFETVELTAIAWRNIPPARVFVCRRPKKA